jgi:hypothetical protein
MSDYRKRCRYDRATIDSDDACPSSAPYRDYLSRTNRALPATGEWPSSCAIGKIARPVERRGDSMEPKVGRPRFFREPIVPARTTIPAPPGAISLDIKPKARPMK